MNIHGVGELIYDHIFDVRADDTYYLGGAGGGSLGNFLANAAYAGAHATYHTVIGGNCVGAFSASHLSHLGVNAGYTIIDDNAATRIIFELVLNSSSSLLTTPGHAFTERHSFGTTCVVCGSKEDTARIVRLDLSHYKEIQPLLTEADVLYFDKPSVLRGRFAKEFKTRRRGITVMDLGRLSYIRFLSASDIVVALSGMDILFGPKVVFESLMRRLKVNEIENLHHVIGKKLLLVSGGREGMRIFESNENPWDISVPAPNINEVVDDAGAGDAFFGNFIVQIARNVLEGKQLGKLRREEVTLAAEMARNELPKVLSNYGARGHLQTTKGPWDYMNQNISSSVSELKRQAKLGECQFCFQSQPVVKENKEKRRTPKSTLNTNVNSLLTRIAHRTLEHGVMEKISELIKGLDRCLVVGTGGSFPVAEFLELLINRRSNGFARAVRPLEYLRLNKYSDALIVVTYSGKTKDCEAVLQAATRLKVKTIFIVSGKNDGDLCQKYGGFASGNVISYEDHGPLEKGFVSIRGTVLPCALFTLTFVEENQYRKMTAELRDDLYELSESSFISAAKRFVREWIENKKHSDVLDVYGSGFAMPAMRDLESKMVEGDVGVVRLHESKDFSHGRFMSVFPAEHGNRREYCSFNILLRSQEVSPYEDKLERVLRRNGNLLVIESKFGEELGALELLIKVQFFVKVLSHEMKTDFSKPKYISPQGLELYRWKKLK